MRFVGDVDATGAVALQVDEPGSDDEIGTVDVTGTERTDGARVGDDLGDRVALDHEVGADQPAIDQQLAAEEPSTGSTA